MLKSLSIHNFILIESLHIEFEPGFTVFTGETGAGKSILLDALSLALGARTDTSLLREHKDTGQVTAEFSINPNHLLLRVLEDHGLLREEDPSHLVVRRVITRDGKSRAFLNDIPVNLSLLKKIGSMVLEIHGQFDRLMDASDHRDFLDAFGNLFPLREKTQEAFKAWKKIEESLEAAKIEERHAQETFEIWGHYLEELKAFNPQAEEEEDLLKKRDQLTNQDKFKKTLEEALQTFENSPSLESQLLTIHKNLSRQAPFYEELPPFLESLDRMLLETRESYALLEKLYGSLLLNPSLLEKIEERLFELRSLARKHQVLPSQLPKVLSNLLEKFSSLENHSVKINALEKELSLKKSFYEVLARELSEERSKNARHLEDLVQKELPFLKLERALFKVDLKDLPPGSWTPQGKETVEFQIAPNGGILGSLKDIASGGELGRILLALKVSLAQRQDISVIIFDEIDSGMSGAVSSSIGECLRKLSQHVQVMSITHSPQVASKATHHFLIEKTFEGSIPSSRASLLTSSSRIHEIARMLSGDTITQEAQAAAKSLLD